MVKIWIYFKEIGIKGYEVDSYPFLIIIKVNNSMRGIFMFIYENVQNLNDLELSLYEYIIKSKDRVVDMTIRDLAKETHVSTTTILRLCKKLGCDGFSEFKVKFKLDMEERK